MTITEFLKMLHENPLYLWLVLFLIAYGSYSSGLMGVVKDAII